MTGRPAVARTYDVVPLTGDAGPAHVLVDRLWPRGLSRAEMDGVGWMKEVAPSKELRRWYGHEPGRWPEFRKRYLAELEGPEHEADLAQLRALSAARGLVLLTATREVERSAATVLAELLGG